MSYFCTNPVEGEANLLFYLLLQLVVNPEKKEFQGERSNGLNDRVHGMLCQYSDETLKKINYISTNTYSIIMQ